MIELYANVSDEVRNLAENIWNIAIANESPIEAAEFISTAIQYFEHQLTEEEIDFLRFYINMKLEMELNE